MLHINAVGKEPELAVAEKIIVYMSAGNEHIWFFLCLSLLS
jgi:hypothetical protein